jgi:YVTN family beta-propeller protein
VANEGDHSITAVNLSHFSVQRKITLDAAPTAVIAPPEGHRVFVLTPENGAVVEIDARKLAISRRASTGGRALRMRLAPDARSLWILMHDPPGLIRFDVNEWRAVSRIRLPEAPLEFDVSATAAAVSLRQAVAIVDLPSGKIARRQDIGAQPRVIRFRGDGNQILAGNTAERSITVLDTQTGKIIVNLPVGIEPERFCFNADGGQLFVTGRGMDAVVIVSPYQTAVSETILAGRAPGAMAISTRPEYLFAANAESGDVTIIDVGSRTVLAQTRVGEGPGEVLITPDNAYALVLNQVSGDLAVLRIDQITPPSSPARAKMAPLFTVVPVGAKPVSAAVCGW